MRARRLGVLMAAASVAVAALGGCASVKKTDYDAAVNENNELRDRLASVQEELRLSEQDKAQLAQQNADLSGELSSVRGGGGGSGGVPGGRGGTVVMTVAGDVLFNSGQATLRDEGRRKLDEVARAILSQYPGNAVRVEGYTDSDPIRRSKWKTNERLSAERAIVVEEYLVGRGVENDRIYAAAMGAARPKSSKKDSRRVEIVILTDG